jgi:signal transduction histidine kinase
VMNRPAPDVELVLYRICQEAFSNIVKHANILKL